MFGDTGIPRLFKEAYKLGAAKESLRVVIAGGAQVFEKQDYFDIGKRNIVIARKLFWKNNVMLAAEHVGGHIPRTMYLDMHTGATWITSHGQRIDL
jgi:chemotaxis protein CheD